MKYFCIKDTIIVTSGVVYDLKLDGNHYKLTHGERVINEGTMDPEDTPNESVLVRIPDGYTDKHLFKLALKHGVKVKI